MSKPKFGFVVCIYTFSIIGGLMTAEERVNEFMEETGITGFLQRTVIRLMNEHALHVAQEAVEEERKEWGLAASEAPIALDDLLTRIKSKLDQT